MDRCQPASALHPEPGPGLWRTLEYEMDALSGVMIMAGPETAAPDVTYPLNVTGWHAVSVGMLSSHRHGAEIMLRTSGDDTFAAIKPAPSEGGGVHDTETHEVFWKILDLTGQDLVLGQMQYRVAPGEGVGSFESRNSQAVYIKLVPLTDEEASALLADRRRTDTRRLFAHDDAHGVHYAYRPTTAEHIRRNIEPYRHTDFSRLCWEAGGGDLLQYLGNTGRRSTFDGLEDFGPQGYRKLAESWRIFRDKGIDPFQVALDYTHEIGMEFHAGYRVTAFHYPPPIDYFNHGPSFYKGHPELRAIDKDGNATPRISYPESTEGGRRVSVLRRQEGAPVLLG